MYKYWQKYNDKIYSFYEAINLISEMKKEDIIAKIVVSDNNRIIEINNDNLPNNFDDINIPIWAFKNKNWQILIPDNEKNQRIYEIEDWITHDLEYEPDSRFYDPSNMDISDWWEHLNNHFINDDIAYDIMIWLRDSNKLFKI